MKTQTVAALVSSVLLGAASTGSLADGPSWAGVMEEIVVTAQYPAASQVDETADAAKNSGVADREITVTDPNEPSVPVMEELIVVGRYPAPRAQESPPSVGRRIKVATRLEMAPPAPRLAALAPPNIDDVRL